LGLLDLDMYAPSAKYIDPDERRRASTMGWFSAADKIANAPIGMSPVGALTSGVSGYARGAEAYAQQLQQQKEAERIRQEKLAQQQYLDTHKDQIATQMGLPPDTPVTSDMLASFYKSTAEGAGKGNADLRYAGQIVDAKEKAQQPYKIATEQRALENARRLETVKSELSRAAEEQDPSKVFDKSTKLRKEYTALTKDFRTVQDSFNKLKSTSPSGAGDLSMLFAYMKILDPGSVVRESEFASAASAGGLGEKLQNAVKRIQEGGWLGPELRQEFIDEATNVYKAQQQSYEQIRGQYTGLAERSGLKPIDVLPEWSTEEAKGKPPAKIATKEEVEQLPKGARFIAPDGKIRTRK